VDVDKILHMCKSCLPARCGTYDCSQTSFHINHNVTPVENEITLSFCASTIWRFVRTYDGYQY